MAIRLKSPTEVELMRDACRLTCSVLDRLTVLCTEGITTKGLDVEADRLLAGTQAVGTIKGHPAYKDGRAFPAVTCVSVNDEVAHGIPGERVVREGDLVKIDFGCRLAGWCGDSARTVAVGEVDERTRRLCEVTKHALDIGIEGIQPDRCWSDIARSIQQFVEGEGFAVVRNFAGHGIGTQMHEDPHLPCFVSRELLRNDLILRPGMVLAIEPIVSSGAETLRLGDDDWTLLTTDGSLAAHYEHTVAVTEYGYDVLTDGQ